MLKLSITWQNVRTLKFRTFRFGRFIFGTFYLISGHISGQKFQPVLLFELTIIVNCQVPLNLPLSLILEH